MMEKNRTSPGESAQDEPSTEWLDARLAKALYCDSMSMRGSELRAIMNLAERAKAYNISGLERLRECCNQNEVNLNGTDVRLLLMLARQGKRRSPPRRFRVVGKTSK